MVGHKTPRSALILWHPCWHQVAPDFAGAPEVNDFLGVGGAGPVGSLHGHYVMHVHGELYSASSFALTQVQYAHHLDSLRTHMSRIAQHRHIVAFGTGEGFLDVHFLAVWEQQRLLQSAGKQSDTWCHYIVLRKSEAAWFRSKIIENTPATVPDHLQLRTWIQKHIKIIIYGETYDDLTPFIRHLATAIFQ